MYTCMSRGTYARLRLDVSLFCRSKTNPHPFRGNCKSQAPVLLDPSKTGGR